VTATRAKMKVSNKKKNKRKAMLPREFRCSFCDVTTPHYHRLTDLLANLRGVTCI
jgi:transcription elongation factor Elf1